MIFTQEQIDEIRRRLSISGVKDTEFEKLNLLETPIVGDEILVIVKDGVNKRISLEELYEDVINYIVNSENKEDFFNVSAYLGRLDPAFEKKARPCTLAEAVLSCPPYIRKSGQVIVFLDSEDNTWKSYQMTGSSDSDWEDINLFSPYNLLDYIDENLGLTPEDEGYIEDSREKGVTQRLLQACVYNLRSEAKSSEERLQAQIDAIVVDEATVNLNISPSTVFVGITSTISLNATSSVSASSIKIKKGSTQIAYGNGTSLSGSDTITPTSSTAYTADFIIAGLTKSVSGSVTAVYPIKIGSGTGYVEGTDLTTPKTSPAGTYNVVVANDGDYVYFNIPSTMTIHGATMSGFNFPLEAPQTVEIDSVSYKSYRSSNTYDAGTITIVIS